MKKLFTIVLFSALFSLNCYSQSLSVASVKKISNKSGNFGNILPANGYFADRISNIGDLNQDGIPDLAVSASQDGSGGFYILFMNSDGTLKGRQKVSQDSGKLNLTFSSGWGFGKSVTGLGDLDGDGIVDLAVSAIGSGNSTGAVYILFMNKNGTVKSTTTIDPSNSFLSSYLTGDNLFGIDLSCIGDLNGDGIPDLAVGAAGEDSYKGAVYILNLKSDGTLKAVSRIASGSGNFSSTILNSGDDFGGSISKLGDLNKDGTVDVAVGAQGDNSDVGAAYVLFLNSNGTVKSFNKLNGSGKDNIEINSGSSFGVSLGFLGDIDGDGVNDIIVGSSGDNDSGYQRGAAYVVFLTSDGHVKSFQKFSDKTPGISGKLSDGELFGSGVAGIDGKSIAIGARGDNDGNSSAGALFTITLHGTAGVTEEIRSNPDFDLYPNPACEYFSLKYNITSPGNVDISLSDIEGKNIENRINSFQAPGVYQYDFDLSKKNVKPGIYILRFLFNDQALYRKIIIN